MRPFILVVLAVLAFAFTASCADNPPERMLKDVSRMISKALKRRVKVTAENFNALSGEVYRKFRRSSKFLAEFAKVSLATSALLEPQPKDQPKGAPTGYYQCSPCICGERIAFASQRVANATTPAQRATAEKIFQLELAASESLRQPEIGDILAKALDFTTRTVAGAVTGLKLRKRALPLLAAAVPFIVQGLAPIIGPAILKGFRVLGTKLGRCGKRCSFTQARALASHGKQEYCSNGKPF